MAAEAVVISGPYTVARWIKRYAGHRIEPLGLLVATVRYEALFHQAGLSNFLLPSHNDSKAANALHGPRLERAIGVIYLPKSERISHYFQARLPEQFDAVLHFDETLAIEPLDRTTQWEVGETEIPETYPSAL